MALTTLQILALNSLPGIGKQAILKLGNASEGQIENADLIDLLVNNSIYKKTDAGKALITSDDMVTAFQRADDILNRSNSFGIQTLSYWESAFPQKFRDIKSESGKNDPSILIFYKGNLELLGKDSIAVIGTRHCLPKAELAGNFLVKKLVERNFCIVSGLAQGCDTVAHKAALEHRGKTIAILGNGLDSVYPKKNSELAEQILESGGLLISEYEVGTPATNFRLVSRDRLQTGISLATVVLQTSETGGTMHAAIGTCNAGKKLYVLKYNDSDTNNHENTRGNHQLVSRYGAEYIEGLRDRIAMDKRFDEIAETVRNSSYEFKLL